MHFESILLLAYYHPRYIDMLKGCDKKLKAHGYKVTRLFADKHYKAEVLASLQKPFGLVIYFGHGEPGVLSGYRNILQEEFYNSSKKVIPRVVLALSCCSLDKKGPSSLADRFVSENLALKVIGYKGKVRFEDNRKILEKVCDELIETSELDDERIFSIAQQFKSFYRLRSSPI